jgi:hypothetical protein
MVKTLKLDKKGKAASVFRGAEQSHKTKRKSSLSQRRTCKKKKEERKNSSNRQVLIAQNKMSRRMTALKQTHLRQGIEKCMATTQHDSTNATHTHIHTPTCTYARIHAPREKRKGSKESTHPRQAIEKCMATADPATTQHDSTNATSTAATR